MKLISLFLLLSLPCLGQIQVISATRGDENYFNPKGLYIAYSSTKADSICIRTGHLSEKPVKIPSRLSPANKISHKVVDRKGETFVVYYYISDIELFDCLRCRQLCKLFYCYSDTIKVR